MDYQNEEGEVLDPDTAKRKAKELALEEKEAAVPMEQLHYEGGDSQKSKAPLVQKQAPAADLLKKAFNDKFKSKFGTLVKKTPEPVET